MLAFSTPAVRSPLRCDVRPGESVSITGTVTEFNWTNPHASFRLDVPNAEGKVESWAIEMNSPNNLRAHRLEALEHQGGRQESRPRSIPLRDGRLGGLYIGITLPDGKYLGTARGEPGADAKPSSAY